VDARGPLEEIRFRGGQAHERVLKVVGDLTDEQLRYRPAPKAHSIGFILWHVARADDNVAFDLTGRSVWEGGRYADRWGHPAKGIGTGWDDEKAASLALPPRDELLGFVREVFAAVDAARGTIDESRFAAGLESRFMSRRTTVADVIMSELSHDNRHLGELEYLKGLLGLRGTATV
jgi:hypothetical protein